MKKPGSRRRGVGSGSSGVRAGNAGGWTKGKKEGKRKGMGGPQVPGGSGRGGPPSPVGPHAQGCSPRGGRSHAGATRVRSDPQGRRRPGGVGGGHVGGLLERGRWGQSTWPARGGSQRELRRRSAPWPFPGPGLSGSLTDGCSPHPCGLGPRTRPARGPGREGFWRESRGRCKVRGRHLVTARASPADSRGTGPAPRGSRPPRRTRPWAPRGTVAQAGSAGAHLCGPRGCGLRAPVPRPLLWGDVPRTIPQHADPPLRLPAPRGRRGAR